MQVSYQVRLSVHNGRTFVGKSVVVTDVKYLPEQDMLEIDETVLVENIPMDQMVVVMMELQLLMDTRSKPGCFGWAPFVFFQAPTASDQV